MSEGINSPVESRLELPDDVVEIEVREGILEGSKTVYLHINGRSVVRVTANGQLLASGLVVLAEYGAAEPLAEIAAERKRQIEELGYDHAHDDAFVNGELLMFEEYIIKNPSVPPRTKLIRAAALLVREIERQDRLRQAE